MSQELSFGGWLRQRRIQLGVTRDELAERVGFSLDLLKKLESGERRPSGQIAHLLADYFRIPSDERDAFVAFARTARSEGIARAAAYSRSDTAQQSVAAPWRRAYAHSTNLPAVLTPLLGREKEVAAALQQVKNPGTRLLTLTGAPGIGKTRLALHIASELIEHFEDGVFFVDLAPLVDPGLVLSTIALTLGLKEAAEQSIEAVLFDYARDKRSLVLLDNFEQVLDAAPGVARLLEAGPWLKALVTSREALHVRGERRLPVPPLELPRLEHLSNPEELLRYASVELFVERSRMQVPDFTLTAQNAGAVARICVALDGLPLAIELAAARSGFLSPGELEARLGSRLQMLKTRAPDLPDRQRTLRGAIEWSYDLLAGEEKQLFRRLAVFAGGRTLEAIEAVCNVDGGPGIDVLDGVQSLIDKSLLRQEGAVGGVGGEPRFVMLETIHEYAREKLEASGEGEALRSRHATYFLKLAEEAESEVWGPQQVEWLDRLDEEHDNFRAALRWAIDSDNDGNNSDNGADEATETGLRLVGALLRFWIFRSYPNEGFQWARAMLERPAASQRTPARAKALYCAGVMAWRLFDSRARLFLEECIAIYRHRGPISGLGSSLRHLGLVTIQQEHNLELARSLVEEAIPLLRAADDKPELATALLNLGNIMRQLGDGAASQSSLQEGLRLFRELGGKWGIALALRELSRNAVRQGNYAEARSLTEESIALWREAGTKHEIADSLIELGELARRQGDYRQALNSYEEALALFGERALKISVVVALTDMGYALLRLGEHEQARASFRQGLQTAGREPKGEALATRCLVGLAGVAGTQGESERAARLLGAADALLEASGNSVDETDQADYDLIVATTMAHLDEATWQKAWQKGRAMPPRDAVVYALEEK